MHLNRKLFSTEVTRKKPCQLHFQFQRDSFLFGNYDSQLQIERFRFDPIMFNTEFLFRFQRHHSL